MTAVVGRQWSVKMGVLRNVPGKPCCERIDSRAISNLQIQKQPTTDHRPLLPRWSDDDISIIDFSVIALQHDRPHLGFVAIERASRYARYLCVIDYRLAV